MNWLKKIFGIKSNQDENALKCPNCKGIEWLEGPGGGSFGNIQCTNCKRKYNNLGAFGLESID